MPSLPCWDKGEGWGRDGRHGHGRTEPAASWIVDFILSDHQNSRSCPSVSDGDQRGAGTGKGHRVHVCQRQERTLTPGRRPVCLPRAPGALALAQWGGRGGPQAAAPRKSSHVLQVPARALATSQVATTWPTDTAHGRGPEEGAARPPAAPPGEPAAPGPARPLPLPCRGSLQAPCLGVSRASGGRPGTLSRRGLPGDWAVCLGAGTRPALTTAAALASGPARKPRARLCLTKRGPRVDRSLAWLLPPGSPPGDQPAEPRPDGHTVLLGSRLSGTPWFPCPLPKWTSLGRSPPCSPAARTVRPAQQTNVPSPRGTGGSSQQARMRGRGQR